MTKTYTPLIIEGKIYVVVDAPEKPNGTKPFDSLAYEIEMRYFDLDLAACTKYETLPEHAPYWKERIGQRVEVEIEEVDNLYGIVEAIQAKHSEDYEFDYSDEDEDSIYLMHRGGIESKYKYIGIIAHFNQQRSSDYLIFENKKYIGWFNYDIPGSFKREPYPHLSFTYAIPPQQKQGDEKPDAVKFAEYMDKYYPISDLFNKGESFDGFYQRFKAGLPPQS